MQRSFVLLLAIVVTGLAAGYRFTERSSRAAGAGCACRVGDESVVTVYAVVEFVRAGMSERLVLERVECEVGDAAGSCAEMTVRPGALVVDGPACVQGRVRGVLGEVRAELEGGR